VENLPEVGKIPLPQWKKLPKVGKIPLPRWKIENQTNIVRTTFP